MYLVTLMRYKVNLKKLFFSLSHREFLTLVGSEKARATNMNCEVIPVVKHDKSEPVVDITYGKYDVSTLEWVGEAEFGPWVVFFSSFILVLHHSGF